MSPRELILETLAESDALTRASRADRLEWLALHELPRPQIIAGRSEKLAILSEARGSFVDGHFIAALLLAQSFIEHTLVEELQLMGYIKGSPSFAEVVAIAQSHAVFPPDWLGRAKKLSLFRNPYAHLKDEDHKHTLGNRIKSERRHPAHILETDAKDAIELMLNLFVATLRRAA